MLYFGFAKCNTAKANDAYNNKTDKRSEIAYNLNAASIVDIAKYDTIIIVHPNM